MLLQCAVATYGLRPAGDSVPSHLYPVSTEPAHKLRSGARVQPGRRGHEAACPSGNHAAESFVSSIRLAPPRVRPNTRSTIWIVG